MCLLEVVIVNSDSLKTRSEYRISGSTRVIERTMVRVSFESHS